MHLLCALLIGLLLCGVARAHPRAMEDTELAEVSGGDGVSFAVHLVINDPALPSTAADSRIIAGYTVDGRTTYAVIKNLRGVVDMFSVNLSVKERPDGGGSYVALSLPGYLHFDHFGYEQLGVQTDPLGPISGDLGRFEINGNLSMQGQFRFWAH